MGLKVFLLLYVAACSDLTLHKHHLKGFLSKALSILDVHLNTQDY